MYSCVGSLGKAQDGTFQKAACLSVLRFSPVCFNLILFCSLAVAQAAAKGRPLPGPVLVMAAENMLMALMWRLSALEGAGAASPSASAVASLGKGVEALAGHLDHIALAEDSAPVQDAITRVQADLFFVFSAEKLKVLISQWLTA
jgi:hypothetical protein